MSRKKALWLVMIVAMLIPASASFACPVCFGDIDHPIIHGLEASILFMVGITYTVITSGVVTFILLRRRARRLAQQTTGSV